MTALEKLRKWAEYYAVSVDTVSRDNQWHMTVDVVSPLAYRAVSGWEPNPEAAAAKIVQQLEQIGEKFDQ